MMRKPRRSLALLATLLLCRGTALAGGEDLNRNVSPLPIQGPKTVIPGFSSYYYVSWKRAEARQQSIQTFTVASAPVGWEVGFPDLERSKGKAYINGTILGTTLKVTPPPVSRVDLRDKATHEIVVEMRGDGETLRQTLTATLRDRFPESRGFSPLPHDPRLFWGNLAKYEENFVKFAAKYGSREYCDQIGIFEGGSWYYDGGRVFFQWADYSRNRDWYRQAETVLSIYRKMVLDSGGRLPGWRVFTEGLKQDFLRNGREESKQAAIAVAGNAAYHPVTTPYSYLTSSAKIREVSYAIDSFLDAAELGEPEHPRLKPYVDILIGYIQAMCVDETETYVQPFMLALASEALIKYHRQTRDPRVLGSIVAVANYCMTRAWVPADQAWWYESYPSGKTPADAPRPHRGAPDLNLLIVPLFAWLHHQTRDPAYLDVGDHAFAAGVQKAWFGDGKHFSQNYRWSLDYVRHRKTVKDRPQAAGSRRHPPTRPRGSNRP